MFLTKKEVPSQASKVLTIEKLKNAETIPLSSLTIGVNRIGDIDVEMLDGFMLIREITEEDEIVVLDEIDERIVIRREAEEYGYQLYFIHNLYFDDP